MNGHRLTNDVACSMVVLFIITVYIFLYLIIEI